VRSPELFIVAERPHHPQHFFEGDEAPAVGQLIGVDGVGQFTGGTKGRDSLLATSKTPDPTPGRFASPLKRSRLPVLSVVSDEVVYWVTATLR
jgi:hypothetical protein